jgi:hypothetical protein
LKSRINQSNLAESQRIWSLVDHGYIPIDWHLDFKSGYRWSEDIWYDDIPHGHKPGVDIKVPWELARMQHMSLLAWAYSLAKGGEEGFATPSVYVSEFRNQVLDFISTNPPRFGVNWRLAMDVGIRAANWLITYDLFRAYGAKFDDGFETEFRRSIYQHGRHIINNLEWHDEVRGNHYLSNIVGLLFIAAYLPCTTETDAWLSFAYQELIDEVERQFTPEGTNYEASTCYHRLSAELVIYATAMVLGLPPEKRKTLKNHVRHLKILPNLKRSSPQSFALDEGMVPFSFPPWYVERLKRITEFTLHITKPNRQVVQIGDNDSGRFLKLQPTYDICTVAEAKSRYINLDEYHGLPDQALYLRENHLDHGHLIAAVNGLFGREDFSDFAGGEWLETGVIRSLAKGIQFPCSFKNKQLSVSDELGYRTREDEQQGGISPYPSIGQEGRTAEIPSWDKEPFGSFKWFGYPTFGLFVYCSNDFYLAIRCGGIGPEGMTNHRHNDQMSFDLNIKGHDFLVDGGTYLYTPMPRIRNEFRSTRAHNTLSMQNFEQNQWEKGLKGLFSMKIDLRPYIIERSDRYFRGGYISAGLKHTRTFNLGDNKIMIEDISVADSFGVIYFNLAPDIKIIQARKGGEEEFVMQIKNSDICPMVLLKGFSRIDIGEGFFSPGYGERVKNRLVQCHRVRLNTQVVIEIDQKR